MVGGAHKLVRIMFRKDRTKNKKNGYSIQTNFRNTAVSTNLVFLPGATFTK